MGWTCANRKSKTQRVNDQIALQIGGFCCFSPFNVEGLIVGLGPGGLGF